MRFKYTALSDKGTQHSGRIEAESAEQAVEKLQQHKMVVTSIQKVNEMSSLSKFISRVRGVSAKKVVMFSKELAILLTSGVSLVESLRIQSEQEDSELFRDQLTQILHMVEDGDPLSVALARFPKTFSPFYVNIVRSGEASGKLQEALEHLAVHMEKSYLLASKVKNAMLYPAVIFVAFVIIGILMMVLVVPQLVSIFQENNAELPLPTRILIWTSDFMVDYFVFIIIALAALAYGIKLYTKTEQGKAQIDKLLLTLPPFNTLFQKYYVARFADNLAILVTSGVPITEALKIAGEVAGNEVYREVIQSSMEEVRVGGSIAYFFEQSPYIPGMVSKMMKIGEKTGKLDSVLKDVAGFYNKEVDIAVDGLTSVIEPIMILILGGGVGILVSAILLPVYKMTESI